MELGVMGLRVPAQELVNMDPGKLIVFREPVETAATLLVGGLPLFQAFVMRHGRKRAARLIGLCPKPKSIGKEPA
jgi:flagellar motor switch protein FliM